MMLPSKSPLANRWLWRIIVGGVVLIPVVFSWSGKDNFRLPKELAFRAEVIIAVSIWAALLFANKLRRPTPWRDARLIIPAAVVFWTFVSMLTATNRRLSFGSFLWIAGWAAIFVVTYCLAPGHKLAAVYAAFLPAVINAAFALLQESGVWNPFFPGTSLHEFHSGLIGNPNDVGTFLVGPAIASLAFVFATKHNRLPNVAVTLFLVVAIVANHTLTALIALVAGIVATIFVVSRKWTALALIVACLMTISMILLYPPLRTRYELTKTWASLGLYDTIFSGRTLPFLAALHMFLDRPLIGVGPGCFKWEFFPYKLKVTSRYGQLVTRTGAATINFGEVHNDHLQILAESGLPGYALFVASLIAIASASFKVSSDETPEADFSRLASFPLAIAFAVVALGQFPFELAAATAVYVYLFALCRAWAGTMGASKT